MPLTRSELITAGVLRQRCAEVIDRVKCLGICGETFLASDWAAAAACPVCASEDHRYICARCDRLFNEPVLSTEHPCGSVTVYDASRRVVFEEEMQAALKAAELASMEAHRRDLKRKNKEDAERRAREEAEARAFAETKRHVVAEKTRHAKERLDFDRRLDEERKREAEARRLAEASPIRSKLDEAAEKAADIVRGGPHRRATTVSAVAVLAGSWMAWDGGLIPVQHNGFIFALVFMVLTGLVWAIGNLPILRPHPAHDTLGKWAFLTWAFVSYAWPPFIALMIFNAFETHEVSIKKLSAMAVVGVAGILTMQRGGSALSMSPPWPSSIPEEFKGRRSFWIWCGLILTFFLNLVNLQGRQIDVFADKSADGSAEESETLVVNAKALNCRSEPSKDAERVAKLVNGQNVAVAQLERVDGWVKLNVDDMQCWALEEYLSIPE